MGYNICMYICLAISRFELLKLKCLVEQINNKYEEVLDTFAMEIDKVQKV